MYLIKRIDFLLSLIGLNPIKFVKSFFLFPRYFQDWRRFKSKTDWRIEFHPRLYDATVQAGTLGEYFWQDTHVAGKIIQSNVTTHIDVGSRIDGFIAIVASSRHVEVFDIRPLNVQIPNVRFHQWDMTIPSEQREVADSVSCLHTLEHVGLGRYSDPIDPDGWKNALLNLIALLKQGGTLWLSVPVGIERVEFNAHRVFSPFTISKFLHSNGMELLEFAYVDNGLHVSTDAQKDMLRLHEKGYALGIFCYRKQGSL